MTRDPARSYEPVDDADLARLARLAEAECDGFFGRNPHRPTGVTGCALWRSPRAALKRFLRERSGGKHPMLVANGRVVLANTAAERLVNPEDESRLRDHAEAVMAGASNAVVEIVLANGRRVPVRCEPILDGGVAVGVVMHLDDGTGRANRPALGLAGLTDTERAIADLVAPGLTNRQIAQWVFVSRHTVDFHLRSIFRKVDVSSRVDLARQIVSQATTR
jgi:DNA-binding CsgD family transcriptional regulator